MSIAFVFPGQGSQRVGMGKALAEVFPESRAVFAEADRVLGFPLSKLCFDGPEAELTLTANTQPALLAASIAAYQALAQHGIRPSRVAGHSLGEYSALVAAGTLSLGEAVVTVRRRGELMQQAVPVGVGSMLVVLGLDLEAVETACRDAAQDEVVSVANINSPGQIVIAGHKSAVERAAAACRNAGAQRVLPLPVSAPFHCALMQPAQEQLEPELEELVFQDPEFALVNNVDAQLVQTGRECRNGLVRQVSSPVRWRDSVEALGREGITTFVEVGPGAVLSALVKKTLPHAQVLNVEDPDSLHHTIAALNREDR